MDHHPVDTTFRKHYYYQTIFFFIRFSLFLKINTFLKVQNQDMSDGLKNVLNLKDTQDLHPYVKKNQATN